MRYLLTLLLSLNLFAYDIKVVPTLSSNPTSGTGVGAMSSIVYQADETSSPSQALVLANYTNSSSYNIFAINNMFFSNDNYQANTILTCSNALRWSIYLFPSRTMGTRKNYYKVFYGILVSSLICLFEFFT